VSEKAITWIEFPTTQVFTRVELCNSVHFVSSLARHMMSYVHLLTFSWMNYSHELPSPGNLCEECTTSIHSILHDTRLLPPFLLGPPHRDCEQRSIDFCILGIMANLCMPRLILHFFTPTFYYFLPYLLFSLMYGN